MTNGINQNLSVASTSVSKSQQHSPSALNTNLSNSLSNTISSPTTPNPVSLKTFEKVVSLDNDSSHNESMFNYRTSNVPTTTNLQAGAATNSSTFGATEAANLLVSLRSSPKDDQKAFAISADDSSMIQANNSASLTNPQSQLNQLYSNEQHLQQQYSAQIMAQAMYNNFLQKSNSFLPTSGGMNFAVNPVNESNDKKRKFPFFLLF